MEFVFKSAFSLALLYSLFFVSLSRETFHRFNRVCLIIHTKEYLNKLPPKDTADAYIDANQLVNSVKR